MFGRVENTAPCSVLLSSVLGYLEQLRIDNRGRLYTHGFSDHLVGVGFRRVIIVGQFGQIAAVLGEY